MPERRHTQRTDDQSAPRARSVPLEDGERERLTRSNEALHARAVEAETGWRQFARLFERAPVGYLLLDEHRRIIEVNQTAAMMLMQPRSSLVGSSVASFVERSALPELARHFREVIKRSATAACHISMRRDPQPLLVYVQTVAEMDAHGNRSFFMVMSSATERYREEQKHSERLAEQRILSEEIDAERRRAERVTSVGALIAESLDVAETAARASRVALPDLATFCAIDLLDAQGHVVRAASASAEADGAPCAVPPLDPYAPRGSALVVRTEKAEIYPRPTPAEILGLVVNTEGADAVRRLVRSYACVPLRAHGRTIGAVTFTRSRGVTFTGNDITLIEELARHIAIVLDNALLYQAAKDADRHKDEFLAMLGHELRNPLAAISVAIACLRLGDASPATRKAAAVVTRQSARLTRLVDDLLDVSRVTRGKITLKPGRVPIDDVIARAVESVRPLIEARQHAISIATPTAPLILEADAIRLEQVIVNLVSNAARYTDPGGRISVEVKRRSGEITVCVRDNGIGMTREAMGRIFDPFTRVAPSLDSGDRGLGIGLTLARLLVELHGGRLTAHSAGPGRGSEFVVHLPESLVAQDLPPTPPTPPPPAPALIDTPRRKLLLVEDEPDLAELTSERLIALGRDVRVARDGIEAVSTALAFLPDLLIVDLGLPGMSGYEVVQRLRREDALAGALFVALTGYGDEAARRRSFDAGFDRHLTKPLSDDALIQLLGATRH